LKAPTRFAQQKTTHRLLAWGVLGFATGRCFSLLTLLFSGGISEQTPGVGQSFGVVEIS